MGYIGDIMAINQSQWGYYEDTMGLSWWHQGIYCEVVQGCSHMLSQVLCLLGETKPTYHWGTHIVGDSQKLIVRVWLAWLKSLLWPQRILNHAHGARTVKASPKWLFQVPHPRSPWMIPGFGWQATAWWVKICVSFFSNEFTWFPSQWIFQLSWDSWVYRYKFGINIKLYTSLSLSLSCS